MTETSIIIPYHSNENLLNICITSILKTTPKDIPIIIVANNSDKKIIEKISFENPRIHVLKYYKNLYYPRAINEGAKFAKSKYLIFCDSDICCLKGWYETLYNLYTSDPKIGYAGVKLLDPADESIIDFGIHMTKYNFSHPYKGRDKNFSLSLKNRQFQAICAATSMIERDLFLNKLNGFNEDLVQAYADIDLSLRLKDLDYEIWGAADAHVYHQGASTISGMSNYLKSDAKGVLFQALPNLMEIDANVYFKEAVAFYKSTNQVATNYLLIDMTTIADKDEHYNIFKRYLNIDYYDIINYPPMNRDIQHIALYQHLPSNTLDIRVPFLYFVDDYRCLQNNALWNSLRNTSRDIIIDRNANILNFYEL